MSHVSPESPALQASALYKARLERLSEALTATNLDAIALNPGPSLTYLTGLHLHLSERPSVAIFSRSAPPVVVMPELEQEQLHHLSYEVTPFFYGEAPESWGRAFEQAVAAADIASARLGVEPTRFRVLELRFLESALGGDASIVSAEEALARLRMYKDAAELATMREAVAAAQTAVEAAVATLHEGITERELAAELTLQLLRAGSLPELPFQPIIAFGPESANPHASPRDVPLRRGDIVLIDWGANIRGYFSDLTRVFAFGEPDEEMVRIAEIVARANTAAREAAAPGVTAGEVDAAARQVIEDAGYGERFIHRTGHGLGLDVHEPPYIRHGNDVRLEPGMTFTIEPGIYLSGRGGIRIEDDMVITEDGAESLSDLPRELRRITPTDGSAR